MATAGLDPDEISAALDLDAFVPAMKLDLEPLFVIAFDFDSDMSDVSKIYTFALTLLIVVFVVIIGDPRLVL